MNVKPIYLPLAESQVSLIKAMIQTITLKPLIVTKQQLFAASETPKDQYTYICMNPEQMQDLEFCLIAKQDLTLNFTYHQLQDIARVNYEKAIEIKHHVTKSLPKVRVFKNVSY